MIDPFETQSQPQVGSDALLALPRPFSPQEWYDISLCVGWTIAMSDGKDEPSLKRRAASMRASDAMRRVLGEQFHTRIVEANTEISGSE